MGATLEIQRAQQMEAIEQQLLRQQARFAGGGGGARHRGGGGGGGGGRAQMGQGFAERLVDDGPPAWGQLGMPPPAAGGPRRRDNQPEGRS